MLVHSSVCVSAPTLLIMDFTVLGQSIACMMHVFPQLIETLIREYCNFMQWSIKLLHATMYLMNNCIISSMEQVLHVNAVINEVLCQLNQVNVRVYVGPRLLGCAGYEHAHWQQFCDFVR